jgi:hypothetical protein
LRFRLKVLKKVGAIVVGNTNYTVSSFSFENHDFILFADFAINVAEYFSKLSTDSQKVYNVADLVNFSRRFKAEKYPDRNTLSG